MAKLGVALAVSLAACKGQPPANLAAGPSSRTSARSLAAPQADGGGTAGSAHRAPPPDPRHPDEPAAARRQPPPAVIGGCGAACSTPEAAVSFWLTQLQHQDRQTALRPLFEWSLLEVDGQPLGERWSAMWADPGQHAARDAAIAAWLQAWSSWVERLEDPAAWAVMRSSGIRLKQVSADRADVTLQLPRLRPLGGGAAVSPKWQLSWQRRGDEWLLARLRTAP